MSESNEVHRARMAAIQPRRCAACGSKNTMHRPYEGRGWTVRCICGLQVDYYADDNEATLAWNRASIKAMQIQKERDYDRG